LNYYVIEKIEKQELRVKMRQEVLFSILMVTMMFNL